MEDCETLVQLGEALARGELMQLSEEPRPITNNPGYGLLKAEHLTLQGKPRKGAQLLQDWHHKLQNDAVMRTTPKRWRKSFLIRASELYLGCSAHEKAADVLIECARQFPIDERMLQLAAQLGLVLPETQ